MPSKPGELSERLEFGAFLFRHRGQCREKFIQFVAEQNGAVRDPLLLKIMFAG